MKSGLIGFGGRGTAHNECLRVLAAKMHITVTTIADCSKELLEKTLNLWPDTKRYNTGIFIFEETVRRKEIWKFEIRDYAENQQ